MSEQMKERVLGTILDEIDMMLRRLSTVDAIRVSYNLLIGKFRVACVCGERENLEKVARDIYNGLLDEIEEIEVKDE